MKRISIFIGLLLLVLSGATSLHAQVKGSTIQVQGDQVVIRIDQRSSDYKVVMGYFGLDEDSLFNHGEIGTILESEGWVLIDLHKRTAKIARRIQPTDGDIYWGSQALVFDMTGNVLTPGYPGNVAYGVNKFTDPRIIQLDPAGKTQFYLPGHQEAGKVIISGNFNDWSTSEPLMTKTDSGWIYTIDLKPGKYLYKYIIDGKWTHDLQNALKEADGHDGYNSMYFRVNHTMQLAGFPDTKKMILTGSFNNWNEHEIAMQKTASGWSIDMYLREGTYTYKFIADGQWFLDPANPKAVPDGNGNVNSIIAKGDTLFFHLQGYTDARVVILTGSFNNWNTEELSMQKTAEGWQIPYVLPAGNYAYKFIVDGQWITDPANPITTGSGNEVNSVRIIKPNHIFSLSGYPNAQQVYVTGSFLNWIEPGYALTKVQGIWKTPIYLAPGKCTYKFIVDGVWITDPGNPQFEQNEFGTGNSVIWMDGKVFYQEEQ